MSEGGHTQYWEPMLADHQEVKSYTFIPLDALRNVQLVAFSPVSVMDGRHTNPSLHYELTFVG